MITEKQTYTKPIAIKIDAETTCKPINVLLNRYVAGDRWPLAASVKTGSNTDIVCGTDSDGLVFGRNGRIHGGHGGNAQISSKVCGLSESYSMSSNDYRLTFL